MYPKWNRIQVTTIKSISFKTYDLFVNISFMIALIYKLPFGYNLHTILFDNLIAEIEPSFFNIFSHFASDIDVPW